MDAQISFAFVDVKPGPNFLERVSQVLDDSGGRNRLHVPLSEQSAQLRQPALPDPFLDD